MFESYASLFNIEVCINGKCFYFNFSNMKAVTSNKPVYIAFDQSTSQTGMCIRTVDGKACILLDFINSGLPDTATYMKMLELCLTKVLKGLDIKLYIIEKPWGGKKYSYSVLSGLKSYMQTLTYTIPELNNVSISEVYPQTWRSGFLDKNKYKGRFKKNLVKNAVREEFCLREPKFEYYAHKRSKVPDSLEAYGILLGYIAKNFDESGVKKVNTTMAGNKKVLIDWELIKCNYNDLAVKKKENPKFNIPEEILRKCRSIRCLARKDEHGVEVMKYNTDLTEYENILRACNKNKKVVVIEIPFSSLYCCYIWNSKEVLNPGEKYLLVGFRRNIKSLI